MKIILDQKAKTNDGQEHEVEIVASDSNLPGLEGRPVIRIVGTGGSWYLSTFTERDRDLPCQIAIDYGRGYGCVNFRSLLLEAFHKLAADRPLR